MNYLLVLLVLYFVLSVLATIFVVRNDEFDNAQKAAQILLTWIVPMVGAIAILLIHWSLNEPSKRKKAFGGGSSASSDIGTSVD